MAPQQKLWTITITNELVDKRLSEILRGGIEGLSSRDVVMTVRNELVRIGKKIQKDLNTTYPTGTELTIDLRHGVKGQSKPRRKPLIDHMKIVYEDEAVVVVNKAHGVVCNPVDPNKKKADKKSKQKQKKSSIPPLVELLKHYWKKQKVEVINPILVHRLDRDTSGLMVVAKNLPSARVLQRQAAGRNMERRYVALVEGRMNRDSGTWESYLYEDEAGWKKSFEEFGRPVKDEDKVPEGAKIAITHFKVLERFEKTTLLELRLETGRTHQIRIHCAESAHPVIGDGVYAKLAKKKFPMIPFGKDMKPPRRMMLHATLLKFQHPRQTTRWLTNKDDIPENFREFALQQDQKS